MGIVVRDACWGTHRPPRGTPADPPIPPPSPSRPPDGLAHGRGSISEQAAPSEHVLSCASCRFVLQKTGTPQGRQVCFCVHYISPPVVLAMPLFRWCTAVALLSQCLLLLSNRVSHSWVAVVYLMTLLAKGCASRTRLLATMAVLLVGSAPPSAVAQGIGVMQVINGQVQYTSRLPVPGCDQDARAASVAISSASTAADFEAPENQTVRLVSVDAPLVLGPGPLPATHTLHLAFRGMRFASQPLPLREGAPACQRHSFTFSDPAITLHARGTRARTQYSWWISAAPADRSAPPGSTHANTGRICCGPPTRLTYTAHDVSIPRDRVPGACTRLRHEATQGQSFVSPATGTVHAALITVWTAPGFKWDALWRLNVLHVRDEDQPSLGAAAAPRSLGYGTLDMRRLPVATSEGTVRFTFGGLGEGAAESTARENVLMLENSTRQRPGLRAGGTYLWRLERVAGAGPSAPQTVPLYVCNANCVGVFPVDDVDHGRIAGDHVVLGGAPFVFTIPGRCARGVYMVILWYTVARAGSACVDVTLRYKATGTSRLRGAATTRCLPSGPAGVYFLSPPFPVSFDPPGHYDIEVHSSASGPHGPTLRLGAVEVAAALPDTCDFSTAQTQPHATATVFCDGVARTAGGDSPWQTSREAAPGPVPPPLGSRAYAFVKTRGPPPWRAFLALGDRSREYYGVRFQYFMSAADAGWLAVEVCDGPGCAADAAPALWRTAWRADSAHPRTARATWRPAHVFWEEPVRWVRLCAGTGAVAGRVIAVSAAEVHAAPDPYPFGQAQAHPAASWGPLPAFADLASRIGVEPCPTVHDLRGQPRPYTFDTCAQDALPALTCGSDGPEAVLRVTLRAAETLVVWLDAAGLDLQYELRHGDVCPGQSLVLCQDEPDGARSSIMNPHRHPISVYVVVSAWHECGPVTAHWELRAVDSFVAVAPGDSRVYIDSAASLEPVQTTLSAQRRSVTTFPDLRLPQGTTVSVRAACAGPAPCGVALQLNASACGPCPFEQLTPRQPWVWAPLHGPSLAAVTASLLRPRSVRVFTARNGLGDVMWADDPAFERSGDLLFWYALPSDPCHVGPRPVACPARPCQSGGACSAASGECEYQPAPDGASCNNPTYFDYDPLYNAVEYLDTCRGGVCMPGPHEHVWRGFAGSCVDQHGGTLPSYSKDGVTAAHCRDLCARAPFCLAYRVDAAPGRGGLHHCALYMSYIQTRDSEEDLAAATRTFTTWDSDGVADGVVVGALPGPDPGAVCATLTRFTPLVSDRFSGLVRGAAWAPDAASIVVRLSHGGNAGVEVYTGPPLLQKRPLYSERYRELAFSPNGLMAFALKQAPDIVLRVENPATGFYEFAGRGPCLGTEIAPASMQHSLAACRMACAQARAHCRALTWRPLECARADTAEAPGLCTLHSERAVETQDSSGCEVCEGRIEAEDGFQLLGPGVCQGPAPSGDPRPRDTNGLLALNRSWAQCRDECAGLPDCLGFSHYNCSGATACVVHAFTLDPDSARDGWHRWPHGSLEVRLASGDPCFSCYAALSDFPVLESDTRPAACAPHAASVRSFAAGALAAHQCRAVCSTAAACGGWRFHSDSATCPVLSASTDRVCVVWTRDEGWAEGWSPGFGFQALGSGRAFPDSCCGAQGQRWSRVTRFSLPNVCAEEKTRWPQMATYRCRFGTHGASAAMDYMAVGDHTHLQYRLDGLRVSISGKVEVVKGSLDEGTPPETCVTSKGWLVFATIPAEFAPLEAEPLSLERPDGVRYEAQIDADGQLSVRPPPDPHWWPPALHLGTHWYVPRACYQRVSGKVFAMKFSADGQYLCAVTAMTGIRLHRAFLFDVAAQRPVGNWTTAPWTTNVFRSSDVHTLVSNDADFSQVVAQFSPDARALFLHTDDQTWRQYATATGAPVETFECGDRFRVFDGFVVCVWGLGSFIHDYRAARARGRAQQGGPTVLHVPGTMLVAAAPGCPWAIVWEDASEPLRLYDTRDWRSEDILGLDWHVKALGVAPDCSWVCATLVSRRPDAAGEAVQALGMYNLSWAGSGAQMRTGGYSRGVDIQSGVQEALRTADAHLFFFPSAPGPEVLLRGARAAFVFDGRRVVQHDRLLGTAFAFGPGGYVAETFPGGVTLMDTRRTRRMPGYCTARSGFAAAVVETPHYYLSHRDHRSCFENCSFFDRCVAYEYLPKNAECRWFGLLPDMPGLSKVAYPSFWPPQHGDQDPRYHCSIKGTSTPSMTPSATQAPTQTATASSTPSRTRTATGTRTATLSASQSATPMPTTTPSATPTVGMPWCGPAQAGSTVHISATAAGTCVQEVALAGPGASFLQSVRVRLRLLALSAGVLVLVLGPACTRSGPGCPDCAQCTRTYAPGDVGATDAVDVARLRIALQYRADGAAAAAHHRRLAARAFEVTLEVVRGPSWQMCLLVAAASLVGVLLLLGAWRWAGMPWPPAPSSTRHKAARVRVHAVFCSSAAAVLLGLSWAVAAYLLWNGVGAMPPLLICGLALGFLGLVGLLTGVVLQLRDPVAYACPACARPVSRWRFVGVYARCRPEADSEADPRRWAAAARVVRRKSVGPEEADSEAPEAAEAGPGQRVKYHTPHALCVDCGKKVVEDRWAPCTEQRLYHGACWRRQCDRLLASDAAIAGWWARHAEAASDVELAELLAQAVERAANHVVEYLLAARPQCHALPPRGRDHRSLVCVAAAAGNLRAVELLLARCAEPERPSRADRAHCSLAVAGLGPELDDVYVHEPVLSYNRFAVFIGLERGLYLYYYTRTEGAPAPSGWCISSYLGDGRPAFRLELEGPPADRPLPPDPPRPRRSSAVPGLNHLRPAGFGQGLVPKWLKGFHLRKNFAASGGSDSDLAECSVSLCRPPGDPRAPPQHNVSLAGPAEPGGDAPSSPEAPVPPAPPPTAGDSFAAADPGGSTRQTAEVRRLTAPGDFTLRPIPHARGLVEVAAAAGDPAVLDHVLGQYRARYPHCFRWQCHEGHGLWRDYAPAAQGQIQGAVRRGSDRCEIAGTGGCLDLRAMTHATRSGLKAVRCCLRPMFRYRTESGQWDLAATPPPGPGLPTAVIVASPGHMAGDARAADDLQRLIDAGLVDPSRWAPPCAEPQRQHFPRPYHERGELLTQCLHYVCLGPGAEGVPGGPSGGPRRDYRGGAASRAGGRAPGGTGLGSRMVDGLEAPTDTLTVQFYDAQYVPRQSAMEFVRALPENEAGYRFLRDPIADLAVDTVLKWEELQRQGAGLHPLHVAALYVYTYELPPEDGGDQIYGAMNAAMRTADAPGIAFWRPLIWHIDVALLALPPLKGRLYRGINCRFDESSYKAGETVCWPAFSSASTNRHVAEEFTRGGQGTLFFLQSRAARSISACSRFPEEGEVLFRPSTLFKITSTLYGHTDIGRFYSNEHIDNVAMEESAPVAVRVPNAAAAAPLLPAPARHPESSNILLQVPHALAYAAVCHLSHLPNTDVECIELVDMQDSAISGRVVLTASNGDPATGACPEIPDPIPAPENPWQL